MQLNTKETARHKVEQFECEKDVKKEKEEILQMQSSKRTGLRASLAHSMIPPQPATEAPS